MLQLLNVKQLAEVPALSENIQDNLALLNNVIRGSYSQPSIIRLLDAPSFTSDAQPLTVLKTVAKKERTSIVVSNTAFKHLQHDSHYLPDEYPLVDTPGIFVRKSVKQNITVLVRKMRAGKRFTKNVGEFDGSNVFELITEAQKLINTITEGGDIAVVTFLSAYKKYQDEIQAKSRGKITNKSRENRILQALGHHNLNRISTDIVLQFLCTHSKSNSSYNRYLARLKRIFNVFLKVGLIVKSPTHGLSKRFEEPNPYNAMSEYEVKWFIHFAIKDPNYLHKMALLVALTTGLRMGNVISLRKQQVDLNAKTLFVEQAKNGRRLTIPINESAYGLIKMLIEQSPNDYLFPSDKSVTGFITHPTECMQRIVNSMKDAGKTDKHLVVHSLRHTAASMWYQQTADLAKVSRMMGHSSLHSTFRYAHTDVEAIREMTNKTWYEGELAENNLFLEDSENE